ncbi:hypothetical protein NUACC21_47630 [Scytonema sp. NUACC21]
MVSKNTFSDAIDAFRTAISFRFFEWLTINRDVFASHKASFDFIWAEFLSKSRYVVETLICNFQ